MRATRFMPLVLLPVMPLAALLPACAALPSVLPGWSANEHEVPLPEEGPAARPGPAAVPETYRLSNGLTVVLLEDHSLPRVVVDTWLGVGSRDEARGRSGFAHLCERLVSPGTGGVAGDPLDLLLERGGGSNGASTGRDRTSYLGTGPPSLLPTLLRLDAERLAALDEHVDQELFDRQREVVRDERRRSVEDVPYGKVELLLPAALYPEGHPYRHPVVGSHEDLQAATPQDVLAFAREFCVASDATLVVAGDFEPEAVKPLVARTFGALPARPAPQHPRAAPARLEREVRVVHGDQIEFAKLVLAWHSSAAYAPGDAELELLATILAEGPSSRLEQRLVLDRRLAQEVDANQRSAELGSVFTIEALAAAGADLEEIKGEILAVLDELARAGPSPEELARARARAEARFLRRMESLLARAEAVQAHRRAFGVSDGFRRDLERWTLATRAGVRDVVRAVLGPGRVDLRILPASEVAPAPAPLSAAAAAGADGPR